MKRLPLAGAGMFAAAVTIAYTFTSTFAPAAAQVTSWKNFGEAVVFDNQTTRTATVISSSTTVPGAVLRGNGQSLGASIPPVEYSFGPYIQAYGGNGVSTVSYRLDPRYTLNISTYVTLAPSPSQTTTCELFQDGKSIGKGAPNSFYNCSVNGRQVTVTGTGFVPMGPRITLVNKSGDSLLTAGLLVEGGGLSVTGTAYEQGKIINQEPVWLQTEANFNGAGLDQFDVVVTYQLANGDRLLLNSYKFPGKDIAAGCRTQTPDKKAPSSVYQCDVDGWTATVSRR